MGSTCFNMFQHVFTTLQTLNPQIQDHHGLKFAAKLGPQHPAVFKIALLEAMFSLRMW